MINSKEAIKQAKEFFLKLYDGTEISYLRVEEFEIDDDNDFVITLGWDEPREPTAIELATSPSGTTPKPTKRRYKTFIVNENGTVEKMKVWEGYNE